MLLTLYFSIQSRWEIGILCNIVNFYHSEISDFLGAENLGEVLSYLSTNPDGMGNKDSKFIAEPMRDVDKQDVIKYVFHYAI